MKVRRIQWVQAGVRIAVLIAAALMSTALFPAVASATPPIRVWIDPGHGGYDEGASAKGLRESDSNLRISRLVEDSIHRQGWTVGASRNDDRFIDLYARTRRAAAWKANVFVSIHSNSTIGTSKGFMDIYQPRSPKSGRLAASIMRGLAPLTAYPDTGSRADNRGLVVLRTAPMTAVLVEALAVDTRTEQAALQQPLMQQQIAEAIVRGLADYLNVRYYGPPEPKATPKPEPSPQPAPVPAPAPEAKAAPQSAPQPAPAPAPPRPPERKTEAKPEGTSASGSTPVAPPTTIWGLLLDWFKRF